MSVLSVSQVSSTPRTVAHDCNMSSQSLANVCMVLRILVLETINLGHCCNLQFSVSLLLSVLLVSKFH